MTGFVGSRAKKRQRNVAITLALLILISIFILFLPMFENINNEIIPNDNIMPDPSEDLTSLASNIEELELSLFQKNQKIKFRDVQIKNLKDQLKNVKSQYELVILDLNNIKNDSDNKGLTSLKKYKIIEEKFTNLKIQNDKNILLIKTLNKKIDDLDNNPLLTNEVVENIISDNKKLKKDSKSYFAKNIKLENLIKDLKKNISDQRYEINLQLEQIKKLKDRSLHGG